MGGLAGYYEHSYSFWADESIKHMYPWILATVGSEEMKTYLFEIRTSFKLRGTDGQITELGWEKFGSGSFEADDDNISSNRYTFLENQTENRLKEDYGMSDDELRSWARAALAFAKQTKLAAADSSSRVIGVVVELDVLTVQQEGEPMDAAKERAIKTESLVPIYVWPDVPIGAMSNNMLLVEVNDGIGDEYKRLFLFLARIRVEDEAVGMELTCAVCLRKSAKGTQISFLPKCKHAVHPRCLFERLRARRPYCPSCSARIPCDNQLQFHELEQLRIIPPIIPNHHC